MVKKGVKLFVFIAIACFVAFITIFSGKNGIYLFDSAINYNAGWLIVNGRVPYKEIFMPLGPLSGYLPALAYKLFGITYMSGVLLSAIIAGIQTFILSVLLNKTMNTFSSVFFAFMLTLAGMPIYGTLYYNNIVVAFAAIFFVLLFNRFFYKDSDKYAFFMWLMVALLGLTKVHVGVIFGLGGILAEIFLFSLNPKRINIKSLLIYKLSPLLVAGFLFFQSGHWYVSDMINLITMPTAHLYFDDSQFTYYCKTSLVLSLLCFVICAIRLIMTRIWEYLKMMMFAILFVLPMYVVYITTPDKIMTSYLCLGVAALICWHFIKIANPKYQQIYKAAVIIFAAYICFIEIISVYFCARKSWDEYQHIGIPGLKMAEIEYKKGFFNGIYVRKSQADVIELIETVSAKYPDKKIFFGPELEMFYSATKRLPPQRWLLWSHPSISFSAQILNEGLSRTLREENYDIIIFVPWRMVLAPYLDFNDLGFKYVSGSKASWTAAATKDKKTAKEIQDVYNEIFIKKVKRGQNERYYPLGSSPMLQ